MHYSIIKVRSDIIYIKIYKTYYYIDIHDQDDVRIYDQNLKRLCVFIPDHWIVDVSNGKLTLPALVCSVQAYQLGYADAAKSSTNIGFKSFVKSVADVVSDVSKAAEFIKLCWIELYPYQHVRMSILKLISDRSLYTKDFSNTISILSRFLPRAKQQKDKEIIDKIDLLLIEHELSVIQFDMCSSFVNFFVFDEQVDDVSVKIEKLVKSRHGNTTTSD